MSLPSPPAVHRLRVAIMTDEIGWHTRQLQKALRARGGVGRCIDLADCEIDTSAGPHGLLLPGYGRTLPDAVIVRGIAAGSFEQVTQRLAVLHALQALGVPVYNEARAIERSVDKGMTSLLLHAAGIPMPPTWATESAARARRILVREGAAGHALVRKPLFGSQGKGLMQVGATPEGWVDLPAERSGHHYLQRFLPPLAQPGHDWRVMVIGGRAVAAMRRVSEHWVHNVAQGARCEAAELTPALAGIAEAASAALGLDYAGVDLMPAAGRHPLQVLEVNGVAAWRGLQQVTPFAVAQALVDDLIDRKMAGLSATRPQPVATAPLRAVSMRRA
ncbi:ATP-grasp domain-containing protein [Leptothrix discophora]|uniref:RimK family alpha-L-glutamate ligase n=1 Tax=Leptothrix discophora TaxID=89 RepID=A0ABT9G8C4_LEPDI|nr:RimK family alpha-L-glutamate ligase [Leptothrix discophora]MDP4302736.1 RimK family alpha-L-glutamate ligase [Leptothrix discophora]